MSDRWDDREAYLAPNRPWYDPSADIAQAMLQLLGRATVHGPIQPTTWNRAASHRFTQSQRPSRLFLECWVAIREEEPTWTAEEVVAHIVGSNVEAARLRARGETYLGELDSTADIYAAPGNVSTAA